MPPSQPRRARFLIIAGAVTALFLPFALAFPPSLPEKLLAAAALVGVACGIAAIAVRPKK